MSETTTTNLLAEHLASDLDPNPTVSQERVTDIELVTPGAYLATFATAANSSSSYPERFFIDCRAERPLEGQAVVVAYLADNPDFATNETQDGTPRWFKYVNRRLNELQSYTQSDEDDEDVYPTPPSETIKEAWRVAQTLFGSETPTPSVVPAEEGGVDFAWHKYGWDLVISVLERETSVWARNRSVGENWSYPLSERFTRVRSILDDLSS